MIGLDTNVLVRYLIEDDPDQAVLADEVIDGLTAENSGYLCTVTLAETYWVLRNAYKLPVPQIIDAIENIANTSAFTLESATTVRRALSAARKGADFADALIAEAARRAGCSTVMTFDRSASKYPGFTLLE